MILIELIQNGERPSLEACSFEPLNTKHNECATVEACGFQSSLSLG